ncbi:MAG: phosphopentomutase [Armatimonadetes bacterium]|nr:phosphopentomutase [Armatimonadota bacterium]MDW8122591.1 phosphopentomutase [Armatimonadota bacterium]
MAKKEKKAVFLLLDGVGMGALPDAADYGDEGSNTLVNLAAAVGGLRLPTLETLGLGLLSPIDGVRATDRPIASFGIMAEQSAGKDSTTGHWELAGVISKSPFPTYPNGFPPEIIDAFTKAIGRPILGNKPASGTAIIEEFGSEHLKTGSPIVYTSADSVFQIAAHEEVVPIDLLYHWCQIARQLLTGPHQVARVIARPFVGKPGSFKRTHRRKDFSVPPPYPTLLDALTDAGFIIVTVGKVDDIFAKRGIKKAFRAGSNAECLKQVSHLYQEGDFDFLWCTLQDFDTLYGHRNDPVGFASALTEFDNWLGDFINQIRHGDLILISADHGNDPTTPSTDHSREYVPVFGWIQSVTGQGRSLGVRPTFSDLANTVGEFFGLCTRFPGSSFLTDLC